MAESDYDVLVGEVRDVVDEIDMNMREVYSILLQLRFLYDVLSELVEEEFIPAGDVDDVIAKIEIVGRDGAGKASEIGNLIRMLSVKLTRRRVRRVEREEEGEETVG